MLTIIKELVSSLLALHKQLLTYTRGTRKVNYLAVKEGLLILIMLFLNEVLLYIKALNHFFFWIHTSVKFLIVLQKTGLLVWCL